MRASRTLMLLGLLTLDVIGCDGSPRTKPTPAAPTAQQATSAPEPRAAPDGFRSSRSGLVYLERYSGGASEESRDLPVIVAVHGLGDRPRGFVGALDGLRSRARLIVPRAPNAYGRGYSWFPFRRDPSRKNLTEMASAMKRAADRLAELLAELKEIHGVRPVLTGFSQGGALTFIVATHHPARVRAAVPLGGWLPEPLRSVSLPIGAHAPTISALHGEADTLVPLSPTKDAVDALQARGFEVELQAFSGVGHSIPTAMRRRWYELLTRYSTDQAPDAR